MKKVWLLVSSLTLVLVLVMVGGCAPANIERGVLPAIPDWAEAAELGGHLGLICSQQNVGLWVTGEGKVVVVPDIALLRLGIEAQAKTVAAAQREASGAMDRVMKALKSNGVSEKDIQTQRFSIHAVRKWIKGEDRERIIGYRVTNMVVAKIRQIDKAGTVIDAVADAGGDLTRIDSISFTVDDPTSYYKEAREKAIEDAMAKAEQMAEVAGVGLGKPLYISEGTAYIPPVRDNFYKAVAEGAAPSPTSISPGEMEIQITVQMVYQID